MKFFGINLGCGVLNWGITLLLFQGLTNPVMADDQAQVDRVAAHLVGVMDTSQKAAANPKVSNVTMTTCQIQLSSNRSPNPSSNLAKNAGDQPLVYLYQEQAMSDELNQPYRQRVLELSYQPFSKTVRSRSFKLVEPKGWINFCDGLRDDRRIATSDFAEVVCAVFLKETSQGFSGTTPANGCPTKARGAVLIRNRIDLHEFGMDTWDRGFDAQGQQLWGAKAESYQFRWKRKGS